MSNFVLGIEPKIIRRTESYARFQTDIRSDGNGMYREMDAYTEYYFIRKIQKFDDENAMHELIKSNIGFIIRVAKQMSTQNISFEDLINEGCIGFIRATYRFDYTRGFKFLSYAIWYIRSMIMKCLTDNNELVRMPLNQYNLRAKVNKTLESLQKEHESDFTARYTEVAQVLEVPTSSVASLFNDPSRERIVSFEDAFESFVSPDTLCETILKVEDVCRFDDIEYCASDDELRAESLCYEMKRALNTLTERESDILILFFGLNLKLSSDCTLQPNEDGATLEEIGETFGMTRERIRQIKEKAIKRLRHTSRSKLLRGYLG